MMPRLGHVIGARVEPAADTQCDGGGDTSAPSQAPSQAPLLRAGGGLGSREGAAATTSGVEWRPSQREEDLDEPELMDSSDDEPANE